MNQSQLWDHLFQTKGKYLEQPHPDIGKISRILKQQQTRRILDIGCGTGRHTIVLCKAGFDVEGIDFSPAALKIARKWLDASGFSAKLRLHDFANRLPYKDNSFDAVIAIQTIHHAGAQKVQQTIGEISRILKTDGLLFVTIPPRSVIPSLKNWKLKEIAGGTFIPEDGDEKGVIHYFFGRTEFRRCLKRFRILKAYTDLTQHYAILAVKK